MAINLTQALNLDPGTNGIPRRAHYAMISCNTSSNWYGAMFYDQDFRPIHSHATQYSQGGNSYGNANNAIQVTDSTYAYGEPFFWNISRTQNSPSSSSGYYVSSCTQRGMAGSSHCEVFSDVTMSPFRHQSSWNEKMNAQFRTINSNHSNKALLYYLDGTWLRARSIFNTSVHANVMPYPGTKDWNLNTDARFTNSIASQTRGSATYNKARKEFLVLSYRTSGGEWWCRRYRNVDFDLYPDPETALTEASVVVNEFQVSVNSNWQTNNEESYYSSTPVMCDNGNVYISVMFPSNGHYLYKFTPPDDTTATTATYQNAIGATTSYGHEQSSTYYGKSMMMSRDGNAVCITSPYYYYHCGANAFIIDRLNDTYLNYQDSNSSNGSQPMPWRDDGFIFYYAGNCYASNYNGGYLQYRVERIGDVQSGTLTGKSCQWNLGYFTGPNTTNYPGMTQVVDYYGLRYDYNQTTK